MEVSKETLDELDRAREINNIKRVEAALFVSGRFISAQELVALTDLNPILLNQALDSLKERYNEDSAMEIIQKGDLWKMDVRNEHMEIVNRLASGSEEFTKAEQETLAVIAHKQPITQSRIVLMRGNKAYDHIKKFVDLGLLKSKRVGRTKELELTNEFYDYFNVKKKDIPSKKKNENSDGEQTGDADIETENLPEDNSPPSNEELEEGKNG